MVYGGHIMGVLELSDITMQCVQKEVFEGPKTVKIDSVQLYEFHNFDSTI